jgi:hypothetical protein
MTETERFWSRTIPEPNTGCLLWMGANDGRYGQSRFKGKNHKAHRVAWEITRGPVPPGLFVCHRCTQHACVNPAHLFVGTRQDSDGDFAERFWARVAKRGGDGCWDWFGATRRKGYGAVSRDGVMVSAHRAAWELAHGPAPQDKVVMHACDNPRCTRPSHLRLGSAQENVDDKVAKGRQARGEAQGAAKLTAEKVRQIRGLAAQGVRSSDIAEMFGIGATHVRSITKGRAWRHV